VVRRLRVPAPDPREDALARAQLLQQASRAGLDQLEEWQDSGGEQDLAVRDLLRARLEQRDFAAWERLGNDDPDGEPPSEQYARLRLGMLQAERERVLELRSDGRTPHEVVEDVLASLDVEESMISYGMRRRSALTGRTPEEMRSHPVAACDHLRSATDPEEEYEFACEDCLREGSTWVHLRRCLSCGHVGCCDSSPRRHATAHFLATRHPVIRSVEPGEHWRWCFVDELLG
jgi:hypothetical protein